jgi:hypothetical protein
MKLLVIVSILAATTAVVAHPTQDPAVKVDGAAILEVRACCTCANGESGCGGWCYVHCPDCIDEAPPKCTQWIP